MFYYTILLLKSSAPGLIYYSQYSLIKGTVVSVPLKTTVKEAVIIAEVEKPEFETAEIVSVSDKVYTDEQMGIAKFISEYYFSSFSEAISLFLPFAVGANPSVRPLNEKNHTEPIDNEKMDNGRTHRFSRSHRLDGNA